MADDLRSDVKAWTPNAAIVSHWRSWKPPLDWPVRGWPWRQDRLWGILPGGTIQVHRWEGMIHVFPANIALLKAAEAALDDIGGFLNRQLR